jgi:hypothetical protein
VQSNSSLYTKNVTNTFEIVCCSWFFQVGRWVFKGAVCRVITLSILSSGTSVYILLAEGVCSSSLSVELGLQNAGSVFR